MKIKPKQTAAIVNLIATIQVGPTKSKLSFTTTKANPQIAAVRTSPAPKIIESSLFSIADKIISFQSKGQYGHGKRIINVFSIKLAPRHGFLVQNRAIMGMSNKYLFCHS